MKMKESTRELLQKAARTEDQKDLEKLSRALVREQYYDGPRLSGVHKDTLNEIALALTLNKLSHAAGLLMGLYCSLISPLETQARTQLPDNDTLGRRFRKQIFLGSGDVSQVRVMLLHEMLDQAISLLSGMQLSLLSGMQQGTYDPLDTAAINVVAQDIHTALTGQDFGIPDVV